MAVRRDYTLVHMTRYTDGVKAVFGTMFPRKELIGYLTPSGMYRAKLSQRLIDTKNSKRYTELGSGQRSIQLRSQQAGGVTKSRKINNRKYLHPVNGIGINSWSHPWSRDREYSVRSSGLYSTRF
jgi:hypothetical protein